MCKNQDIQLQCQGALDQQRAAESASDPMTPTSPHSSQPAKFADAASLLKQDPLGDQILPAFVESCVKESMRLYPVVPGSTRKVTRSLVLQTPGAACGGAEDEEDMEDVDGEEAAQFRGNGNGYGNGDGNEADYHNVGKTTVHKSITVPTNTFVNINFYALHRNEATWGSNADSFDATRFMKNNNLSSSKIFEGGGARDDELSFAPFSHGHRGCIGKHLALCEIRLAVKELLSHYTWRFADSEYGEIENIKSEALTVRPQQMLPVIITKRPEHVIPRKVPVF